MQRPTKISHLMKEIHKYLENGSYRYVGHAQIRLQQRKVTRPEVRYVLKTGWHEKSKDSFKEDFFRWNYAVRGKTVDKRELRVAVCFDSDNMLVVTVIDLSKKDE